MFIKQLSVFIENTQGNLSRVTDALAANNINIISLSLADTSDFGLLRMIVSEPEKSVEALKNNGFMAKLADVIAVKTANESGAIQKLLSVISKSVNVEYMYILSTSGATASVIIKATPADDAVKTLTDAGYTLYTPEEAYSLQA
ncbi:MAG: amino acid-binding protein [Lachnospiraceae bacterium]|nr:amino acid-binding protein [Lachnospiraceae bacterium]